MKREGRQHGMVRSYPIEHMPNTRFTTRFVSLPTAGLFTKVSSKPTSHSKFTGKCATPHGYDCHLRPVCKSKNKTKGTQKHKNGWFKDRPDSDFSGLTATETLDHLSCRYMEEDEVEDENGDQVDDHVNYSCTLNDDHDNKCNSEGGSLFQVELVQEEKDEDEDWCFVESCP